MSYASLSPLNKGGLGSPAPLWFFGAYGHDIGCPVDRGDRLRRSLSLCWVVGLLLVSVSALVDAGPGAPKVVLPGSYHGTEVPYEAGPGWLALVAGEKSALVPVEMNISIQYDPILDAEEGPHSGKHVSFGPAVNAVVLLKGSPFQEGAVSAATVAGGYAGLSPKVITFGNQTYSLELDGDCEGESGQCDWILSDGSTVQVVGRLGGWFHEGRFVTEGSSAGFLWAGDLDGDDRLDLVVDVSDHYNAVAEVLVLLSSAAESGDLVGEVAAFSAVGC